MTLTALAEQTSPSELSKFNQFLSMYLTYNILSPSPSRQQISLEKSQLRMYAMSHSIVNTLTGHNGTEETFSFGRLVRRRTRKYEIFIGEKNIVKNRDICRFFKSLGVVLVVF